MRSHCPLVGGCPSPSPQGSKHHSTQAAWIDIHHDMLAKERQKRHTVKTRESQCHDEANSSTQYRPTLWHRPLSARGELQWHPLAGQAQACGRLTKAEGPEGPMAPAATTGKNLATLLDLYVTFDDDDTNREILATCALWVKISGECSPCA